MLVQALEIFLIAITAGVFGSILGLGGGIIIVPVLTLLFNAPMQTAVVARRLSLAPVI